MTLKNQIAYLVTQYPTVSGTFILREIQSLRKLGFVIKTASINQTDRSVKDLTDEEVKEVEATFYVKSASWFQMISDLFKTLATEPLGFFRGLWEAFRLGGTDLKQIVWGFFYFIEAIIVGQWMGRTGSSHLHVHFANSGLTVGYILSKIFPYTYSYTVHGFDVFYQVKPLTLKQKTMEALFVSCISQYTRSQLMKLTPFDQWEKLHVCRLGVDPENFKPSGNRSLKGPVQLLSIGRLIPGKGTYLLIQAAKEMIDRGYALNVSLVGDGPERESLKAQVKRLNLEDNVQFHGALNAEATLLKLKQADIFVLPSFSEGVPVSLMEAMSMEIPCISSRINGIPELIDHLQDGILCTPSSLEEIINGLELLLNDEKFREKIGKQARQRVLSQYNLTTNAKLIADRFEEYLTKKKQHCDD